MEKAYYIMQSYTGSGRIAKAEEISKEEYEKFNELDADMSLLGQSSHEFESKEEAERFFDQKFQEDYHIALS